MTLLNLIHKWICKQDLAHIQRYIGSMISLLNVSLWGGLTDGLVDMFMFPKPLHAAQGHIHVALVQAVMFLVGKCSIQWMVWCGSSSAIPQGSANGRLLDSAGTRALATREENWILLQVNMPTVMPLLVWVKSGTHSQTTQVEHAEFSCLIHCSYNYTRSTVRDGGPLFAIWTTLCMTLGMHAEHV